LTDHLDHFDEIWFCDFEFSQPDGEIPEPICMVAREYRTGRTIHLGQDALRDSDAAPFRVDDRSLFVSYYASAELNCFLSLDWQFPTRILDLFAEFRCLTSGLSTPCGAGLLGALAYFGIDGIDSAEKDETRQLAMRGGPYTESEGAALLDYCETDVVALDRLLPAMSPTLDLPRALLRGRYMAAAARMEFTGIPVDVETLQRLRGSWESIKSRLIVEVDADFGVFVPTNQRHISPDSAFGQAILREAGNSEVDPHELVEAVDYLWRQERESTRSFYQAKREARKVTGLTVNRIAKWENGLGRDHSRFPGLDETARELAGRYPELGIGRGYESDTGYDQTDYSGRLWGVLRDERDRPRPRTDPVLLRQAVEMVVHGGSPIDQSMSFSAVKFAEYLARESIPWPRLESGALDLSDDAFREMCKRFPRVSPLRELRHALSQMRLSELPVGSDRRNRCLLSAFRAKTGRNQPSNAKFLFGPSCWLRSLIKPAPGFSVAYVDWSQQEWGIAAALSGDENMLEAYSSTDPYLTFACQAGAVPSDATKETHPIEREQFKVCALAVQYGMQAESLAFRLGQPQAQARHLLSLHKETYPRFWKWSQAAVDRAMLYGSLHTVFGWLVHVGPNSNPRSLANFPCQANGAEMLRLACCMATERGIRVCAPVHDAVLIEGPIDDIESVVAETQKIMAEASRIVLSGFELRTDAEIVAAPDRYSDKRGVEMWGKVMDVLDSVEEVVDASF
jgi:hypothetical protein